MEPPHASGPYCEECDRRFKSMGALKGHRHFKHDKPETRWVSASAKEPEEKRAAPRKDRQPRPKAASQPAALDDLEAQVGAFHNLIAFGLVLVKRPAMAQCLVEDTPNIAHQWAVWAASNPAVERGLRFVTGAAGGFAVAAAYLRTVQTGMIETQQARFAAQAGPPVPEQPVAAEEPFAEDQAEYEYVPNGADAAAAGAATTY